MNEFNPTIYLTSDDEARLADKRIRIIQMSDPLEPCDNEDLVFEKASDIEHVPSNALMTSIIRLGGKDLVFFTTEERCKQMVSEDPKYWTKEKLAKFAKIEKQLYYDWYDGHVYGYIIEVWDEKQRKWIEDHSFYGYYGVDGLLFDIKHYFSDEGLPICVDELGLKDELEMQFK